jgi:hypothetical protein
LKKLYKEKLRNLYSLPSVIRMIGSKRITSMHVASMVEKGNAYRILVGKTRRKYTTR